MSLPDLISIFEGHLKEIAEKRLLQKVLCPCYDDCYFEPKMRGIFCEFPMIEWGQNDHAQYDDAIDAVFLAGKLTPAVSMLFIEKTFPGCMRSVYLRQIPIDPSLAHIVCREPKFPEEYIRMRLEYEEIIEFDNRRRAAMGRIAHSIQYALGSFLAKGEDALAALHWPGDPKLKLDDWQRIGLGIFREMFLLKRFPNLTQFWLTFDRLRREGRRHAYIYHSRESLSQNEITQIVLADDPDAKALLQLLNDIREYA